MTLRHPARLPNLRSLAPLGGAGPGVMDRDAKKMRGDTPVLCANLKAEKGVREIANFILEMGGVA